MPVCWIGADHQDDIAEIDRGEILRARGRPQSGHQAVAGRRMAHSGAGIDVVVAERRAHQLLHEIGVFIGAARRGDAADAVPPIGRLQALELGGGVADRFVPAHLGPWVGDLGADHRLGDAVLVRGVTPGKPPLDAGMPGIGLAVLERHHAHNGGALHLRLEGAAYAAIGAGGHHRMLRLAQRDHALFGQRRRRAGLHACAAGDAFGAEEIRAAGRNLGVEAAPLDGQREGALHFLTRPHAARADDAFGGFEGEIRVALVLRRFGMVCAVHAVANVAQPHDAGHVLQLAIAIGGTGQAVKRMVGDV